MGCKISLLLAALLLLGGCRPGTELPSTPAEKRGTGLISSPALTAVRRDVTGEWNRTGWSEDYAATVTISRQTEKGFVVSAGCSRGAHSGELGETSARFTGPATAVMEVYGSYEYREETGPKPPVYFLWVGDAMIVTTQATDTDLGFGAFVSIDGVYTRGEPRYENPGDVEELLTPEERELVRSVVGNNYDWEVIHTLELGYLEDGPCRLPDGSRGHYFSANASLWADTLEMALAEDGRVYVKTNGGFYTNDPAAGELPRLWPRRDEKHDFFYVPTGGKLGTVLVTVETGEDTWDGLYQCTFSVWDGEDLSRPIQTFEKAGMICWSERLDANFDGYMDFTYTYYHGANNATYGLYLWDEAEKRFVESGEFWGYGLSPNEKTRTVFNYIHSSAASGVQEIYRWEDGKLVCVRTVEVDVSLDWDSQELVVRDWVGDEGIEVYRKTFAMSEDSPIYDEAVKWHDLDYHGEEG